jgi:hypothetical protein
MLEANITGPLREALRGVGARNGFLFTSAVSRSFDTGVVRSMVN